MLERPGNYWHMLPQHNQVRKAIWEAVNPRSGKRRIDEAFPDELFKKRHSDMLIQCRFNTSTWQALGSDNYQSFIGSPPVGVVNSEWALANPQSRGYLRPILAENNGWQIFIGTPRGKNHAYRTFNAAKNNPDSLAILQDVESTGVLTQQQLETEKAEYIQTYGDAQGVALFEQEWYCSFESAILGAVWGSELRRVDNEGRIRKVPHQPGFSVYTAWDIGRSDATAVWFWQFIAGEVHIIDYICESLKDPDWFAGQLLGCQVDINIEYNEIKVRRGAEIPEAKRRRAYKYGKLWLPHDAKAKTFAAKGKSLEELFAAVFGWGLLDRVPSLSVFDGIQAVRKILPRCYFDESVIHGVDALKAYRYEYDEKLSKLKDKPLHDWASNPADAFRYMAICAQEAKPPQKPDPFKPKTEIKAQDLLDEHFRKMKRLRNA